MISTVHPGFPADHVPHFGAQPLCSNPITGSSSLIRVSPPLSSASLLSASAFGLAPFRLTSLARFTCFVTRPEPGSCHLYTGSPRNQQFRILFRSSPEIGQPWILMITCSSMPGGMLTMLHRVVRLRSPSWFPHDGIPVPPFPHPFTTSAISAPAACGCLHPTPISECGGPSTIFVTT